jgi:hypothetical protein
MQCQHRFVDVAVLLAVEVDRAQEVGDLQDRIRIDEDGPENALLSLDGLR